MFPRPNRLTLSCALLGLVSGCDAWLTKPAMINQVSVAVARRSTGAPIAGVSVVLYTGQRPMGYGTTDSGGRYVFRDVPQGLYGVRAIVPPGFEAAEDIIGGPPTTVEDGLRVTHDTAPSIRFTLLKRGPGSLSAFVTDAAGVPLKSVMTTLYNSSRILDSVATNAAGAATFTNLPFGAYGIVVTRPTGFQSFSRQDDSLFTFRQSIIVDDGSVDSVHVAIQRCAANVRVQVHDQHGDPVPGAGTELFDPDHAFASQKADQSGLAVYSTAPCVTVIGARVIAPPGYFVIQGRGTEYMDGIALKAGETASVSLTLFKV